MPGIVRQAWRRMIAENDGFYNLLRNSTMGQITTVVSADASVVDVYLAMPAGRPRGAVVVVQEIFGVNSHIRSVADAYAAEGYVALAPATFQRVASGVELGYGEADIKTGFGYKRRSTKAHDSVAAKWVWWVIAGAVC
jgi:dienelactone hydrolase